MKSLKIIFRGLLLLGVFVVFNASMCSEDPEFLEANANGYYFVGVVDQSGARGIGHLGFFLVSPTEIRYSSLNWNKSKNFVSEEVTQTDFNTLYQVLINENPDYKPAEAALSKMITDMQRYEYGFYLKVDKTTFDEMKNYTRNYSMDFNPLTNNCIHYFRSVLGIANPNALNVNVDWNFDFAITDFSNLCSAVNGNSFTNYKYWLKEVAKLRR